MLRPPHGLVLVARLRGDPVGCGALRFYEPARPDIKRLWVDARVRGLDWGGGCCRARGTGREAALARCGSTPTGH